MKAIKEIGLKKSLKFFFWTIFELVFSLAIFPPLRVWLLRIFGAKIGKNVIIDRIAFINLHNQGLKNLKIGDNCFLGRGVLLDLAGSIVLEKNVTLAFRSLLITHLNVGYQDHLLQKKFPRRIKGIIVRNNCFIGAGTIILSGVTIGEKTFVAAGSLVSKSLPAGVLAGGNPVAILKKLKNPLTR